MPAGQVPHPLLPLLLVEPLARQAGQNYKRRSTRRGVLTLGQQLLFLVSGESSIAQVMEVVREDEGGAVHVAPHAVVRAQVLRGGPVRGHEVVFGSRLDRRKDLASLVGGPDPPVVADERPVEEVEFLVGRLLSQLGLPPPLLPAVDFLGQGVKQERLERLNGDVSDILHPLIRPKPELLFGALLQLQLGQRLIRGRFVAQEDGHSFSLLLLDLFE